MTADEALEAYAQYHHALGRDYYAMHLLQSAHDEAEATIHQAFADAADSKLACAVLAEVEAERRSLEARAASCRRHKAELTLMQVEAESDCLDAILARARAQVETSKGATDHDR